MQMPPGSIRDPRLTRKDRLGIGPKQLKTMDSDPLKLYPVGSTIDLPLDPAETMEHRYLQPYLGDKNPYRPIYSKHGPLREREVELVQTDSGIEPRDPEKRHSRKHPEGNARPHFGEPFYRGPKKERDLLKRYARPALYRLGKVLEEKLGEKPYLGGSEIRIGKLETQHIYDFRTGKKRIAGKQFGRYEPETGEIVIDPVVFHELNDPERKELIRYHIDIPSPEEVIAHEAGHGHQDYTGAIYKAIERYGLERSRAAIEGAADQLAVEAAGGRGAYKRARAGFREQARKRGFRRAYLDPEPLI